MTKMDPKTVEKLEGKIEEAIAEIIVKMGVRKLPLLPSRHTMHLMAKAAVAVYEAAVENDDRGRPIRGTSRWLIAFQEPFPGTVDNREFGSRTADLKLPLQLDHFGVRASPGCLPCPRYIRLKFFCIKSYYPIVARSGGTQQDLPRRRRAAPSNRTAAGSPCRRTAPATPRQAPDTGKSRSLTAKNRSITATHARVIVS